MIKVPAYLVSKIKVQVRLLSTTSLLQTYPDETITIEAHQLTLSGSNDDDARGQVIATYQLPMPTVKLQFQRGWRS